KNRMLEKARRNMVRIWYMGIRSGFLSTKASLNLWETLVRTLLEYGSEIWGNEVWLAGEKLQMEMGRRLLRCSSKTTLLAIQGDLGMWSLRGRRDLKKLVYWGNLMSLEDTRLCKLVYVNEFIYRRNVATGHQ